MQEGGGEAVAGGPVEDKPYVVVATPKGKTFKIYFFSYLSHQHFCKLPPVCVLSGGAGDFEEA